MLQSAAAKKGFWKRRSLLLVLKDEQHVARPGWPRGKGTDQDRPTQRARQSMEQVGKQE